MAEYLLKMEAIEKSFSGTPVLKKVDFEVRPGEVHALMGENGAGKSTLIKILTGFFPKDGGKIYMDGQQVEINSRNDATKYGISAIYQELSLIPTLSVMQNIMLGKERTQTCLLRSKEMKKEAQQLIDRYGFGLKPDVIVETLPIAQRQTVEILKALNGKSRLIIMDEPTASLSNKESESLFQIIRQLKEQGVSIIYISHRLEEVYRLADRLTILRDGARVAVLDRKEIVPKDVAVMMIGKALNETTASENLRPPKPEVVLKADRLTRKGVFQDISFELHKGEILGFSGLVGSGRTEVMRAVYGADNYDSGTVLLNGKPLPKNNIGKSISLGFGLVPEDRISQGFTPLLSIERNVALTNYDTLSAFGFVRVPQEKRLGAKMVKSLNIKPGNPLVHVGDLSGGNQQKAVLAKWLSRGLNVLIIDEPTAGIDIGAKDEIYKILENLAENGTSIILISSDLKEVLRVSHRILVMRKGKIFTEFSEGSITQEDLLMAESGITKKGA